MATKTFKIICLDTETELDTVMYSAKFSAQDVVDAEKGEYSNQSSNIWAVCDSQYSYQLAELENETPSILCNDEYLYNEAIILGLLHPETLETFDEYLY